MAPATSLKGPRPLRFLPLLPQGVLGKWEGVQKRKVKGACKEEGLCRKKNKVGEA